MTFTGCSAESFLAREHWVPSRFSGGCRRHEGRVWCWAVWGWVGTGDLPTPARTPHSPIPSRACARLGLVLLLRAVRCDQLSPVVILHFNSEVRLAFQPFSDEMNAQGSELMPFFPFLFLIIWTAVSLLLLWTCHKHSQNNFPTLRHSARSDIGRSQLSSLGLIAIAHPHSNYQLRKEKNRYRKHVP